MLLHASRSARLVQALRQQERWGYRSKLARAGPSRGKPLGCVKQSIRSPQPVCGRQVPRDQAQQVGLIYPRQGGWHVRCRRGPERLWHWFYGVIDERVKSWVAFGGMDAPHGSHGWRQRPVAVRGFWLGDLLSPFIPQFPSAQMWVG